MLRSCGAHYTTPKILMASLGHPLRSIPTLILETLRSQTTYLHKVAVLDDLFFVTPDLKMLIDYHFSDWMTYTSGKFCPECAKSGHLPWQHDFNVIDTCLIHHCILETECKNCKREFSWNRRGLNICECGYECVDSTPASDNAISRGKIIEQCIANKNPSELESFLELESILNTRYELTIDEYDSLITFLRGSYKTFSVLISTTVGRLASLPLSASLAPLLCSKMNLIRYHAANMVTSKYFRELSHPSGSPLSSFCLSRGEIRYATGANPKTIDWLLKMLNANRTTDTERSLRVSFYELDRFYRSMRPQSQHRNGKSLKFICAVTKQSTAELLEDIISGSLAVTYFPESRSLSDIEVDASHVMAGDVPAGFMTIDQVCTHIGSYPDAIHSLRRKGFLKAIRDKSKNNRLLFLESDVEIFHQQFVLIGEIANKRGVNPKAVSENLIANGITPVSGPKIDRGIINLFKRSDIVDHESKTSANNSGSTKLSGWRSKPDDRIDSDQWVNSSEAAEYLGVSVQQLSIFVSTDLLVMGIPSDVTSKRIRYFQRDSLSRTKAYVTSLVSIESLAKSLGVTIEKVHQRVRYLSAKRSIFMDGINFISQSDSETVRRHFGEYLDANSAASLLGVKSSDINNWWRLGYLKALSEDDSDFIPSPRLYKRSTIVDFNRSELVSRRKYGTVKRGQKLKSNRE